MNSFLRLAFKTYLFTWIAVFLLIEIATLVNDGDIMDGFRNFTDLTGSASFLKGTHFIYGFFLLLALCIRYFVRTYRKRGFRVLLKRFSLLMLLPALVLFSVYKYLVHQNASETFTYPWDPTVENTENIATNYFETDKKHRGMSVFGWRELDSTAIRPLVKNNVEWVAVIPFFYQEDEQTSQLVIRNSYDRWSRRDSMFIDVIQQLHESNLRVHLKPHLWMREGWRSNIDLASDDDWDRWFESYRITMLHYALMAQHTGAELLCIGTELRTSIREQPEKWCELVQEIKTLYSGDLTYAANWDGDVYEVPFWEEMDFIGVQAYFPLTDADRPDLATIKSGWDRHKDHLETLAKQYEKPILFTEVGYKSEASATIKPWEWGSAVSILYREKSHETQLLAYEAMFQKLWHRDWFAGVYIWQWNTQSSEERAQTDLNFSPRFKPAENVIAKWFGKNKIVRSGAEDSNYFSDIFGLEKTNEANHPSQ